MDEKAQERDFSAIRAAELEPWLPYLHGNRFASVVAVKGELGEAEQQGKPPFFGADGEALENALEKLGYESNSWCGIVPGVVGKDLLSAGALRLLIETIDPLVLLALDVRAAHSIQASFGEALLPDIPKPGQKTRLLGRTFVLIDGFEAALVSEPTDGGEAKRRVWKELKVLQKET